MTDHLCNADPALGPVCSHLATGDLLTALGFPVKVVDKCVGAVLTVREGTSLEDAVYAAFCAGVVRLCNRTGREHYTGTEPVWLRDRYRAVAA